MNLSDNEHVLMPAGGPGASSAMAVFEGAARCGHTLMKNIRAVKPVVVRRHTAPHKRLHHMIHDNACSRAPCRRTENGPYQLAGDGEVEEREIAWDVNSNIVFVDSPIGVGYSYSDDPRDRVLNESVTAADLLDFLEEFLDGAQVLGFRLLIRQQDKQP